MVKVPCPLCALQLLNFGTGLFAIELNLSELSSRLRYANSFDARWTILNEIAGSLGADWVVLATVSSRTDLFHSMYSSLPREVIKEYLSLEHYKNDLLARHAVRVGQDLIWQPHDGWKKGLIKDDHGFARFFSGIGARSVFSTSTILNNGRSVVVLTFCSQLAASEFFESANLGNISQVCNLILPWLTLSEGIVQDYSVRVSGKTLSLREIDVLEFLASGYQIARIGELMAISDAMVAKHAASARKKLGSRTTAQAIATAIRERLIPL